jgi:tRNA U38,U39,U40 pseudouridine synthase TruA
MVRRMVFVQISCGQGKLEPEIVSQVLAAPEGQSMFQGLAPSQGLCLIQVVYPS